MRTKLLALLATSMAVVGIGLLPTMASAGPLVKSDCPAGKACLWEGSTYGGKQAFFNEEKGCKHLNNISAHSAYNHTFGDYMTLHFVEGYTPVTLFPGQSENGYPTITEMCLS